MRQISIHGKDIMINGRPSKFRSGAMHYFRIHPDDWMDRLTKLKQCGLNTVETYIPWNLHEENEGDFSFSGKLDFARFVKMAESLGLMVILRPGPYICSEWDFGGLPAWLLNKPGMRIRCSNKPYLDAVDRYFNVLLPKLKPLQWTEGGPVIMMQVENEYGTVGNDQYYLRHLYEFIRNAGVEIPLFISDWGSSYAMECGSLPETLLTVNCRNHPTEFLDAVQKIRSGPKIIMELWSGVSHRWNSNYCYHDADDVAKDVEELLQGNVSFNFYMFHGGTTFGFMPGALQSEKSFEPYLNSYDTDAPLDEAGNPTEKYFKIQALIKKYCPEAETGEPAPSRLQNFPSVEFTESAELFEQLPALSRRIDSVTPEPMETFGQNYGFILYRGNVGFPEAANAPISLENLADRAWIYGNGERLGIADVNRNEPVYANPGRLDILVENQGRVSAGMGICKNWNKGITGVHVNRRRLYGWEIYPLPLNDLSGLKFGPFRSAPEGPCFHRAVFPVETSADTYIRIPYGMHGIVWLNGENLGHYRAAGPQFALYAPAPILKKGENELIILELEGLRGNKAEFIDRPDHAPALRLVL